MDGSCISYSRSLSPAALKILAVLRAQSHCAGKTSHNLVNSHRQIEGFSGSQGELLSQNQWNVDQEAHRVTDRLQVSAFNTSYQDHCWWQSSQASGRYQPLHTPDWLPSSQTFTCWDPTNPMKASEASYQPSHIYSPQPSSYQSGQSHYLTQYKPVEKAPSFLEICTLHRQTSERVFEPREKFSEETRSPFIHAHSPDSEFRDQVVLPEIERSEFQDNATLLICHPVSSHVKIIKEKAGSTDRGAQTQQDFLASGNSTQNEIKDCVGPSSQVNMSCAVQHKDGSKLCQKRESQATDGGNIQSTQSSSAKRQELAFHPCKLENLQEKRIDVIVKSEQVLGVFTGQRSSTEQEENSRVTTVNWNNSGCSKASSKETQEESQLPLQLSSKTTASEKKSNSLFVSLCDNMKNISCPDSGEVQFVEKYSDNIPKIQEIRPLLLDVNKDTSVKDQVEGCHAEKNTQEMDHQTEHSLMEHETDLDDKFVGTGRSEEAHSNAVRQTDIGPAMQLENEKKKVNERPERSEQLGKGGASGVLLIPPADSLDSTSTESCGGAKGSTPTASPGRSLKESRVTAFQPQYLDNQQTPNGNIRSNSSVIVPPSCISATLKDPSAQTVEGMMSASLRRPCHFSRIPPLVKRKLEMLEDQRVLPPPKISLSRKWQPPPFLKKEAKQSESTGFERAKPATLNTGLVSLPTESLKKSSEAPRILEDCIDQPALKQNQRPCKRKRATAACKAAPSSCVLQSRQSPQTFVSDQALKRTRTLHEDTDGGKTQNQTKASYSSAFLTSHPRVKDCALLNKDEQNEMLQRAKGTKAVMLTMVYRDGSSLLDPEQKFTPAACGLLMLMKNELDPPEDPLSPTDSLIYLKLERAHLWAQQDTSQNQELFTRDMLLQVLTGSQLVVCFKAKDLLCTALQFYQGRLSWKQVVGCRIHDPQVSGWLLDPANPSSCYQDLVNKHLGTPQAPPALGAKKVSQLISGLSMLYRLNTELRCKLQIQGLLELYSDIEMNMISVLAVMESHRIRVDKDALRRTSDLLGTKMKQLEQEAHRAAGQIFLVTSNTQLRTVLFDKLCLHEQCENRKLPKTLSKQQQSTSEAALLQLQHLHPLPRIILEYRQVHKLKTTFVDGILSCTMSKDYISSKWYQTSAVTGRITAKQPNFQALPRQPLQITKKQHIQGKEEEVVNIHPRAMFIPQTGWTFLAADFCQVELRLLAHLSSDPELLRIFTQPHTDVFTMMASQWKGLSEAKVTSEDREHAKRIVYSVVYGAGRERLSEILGMSAEQASQFQDSFLEKYKELHAFIQRTIQLCHKQGYVLSIMGRRRTLTHINSADWAVRMQAERQAVNFVVQGSAADLCKMAMIRISDLVASSSSLSARLIAQLHDELLYEVEDSQVEEFSALVRSTMESLQHIEHLGVHLKVPLRVAVSSGKSWGSMSDLNVPPTSQRLQ